MAWIGKVVDKSPDYKSGEVSVTVQFFDDAEPARILHEQVFSFPAWMSIQELAYNVRRVGANERRKRTQVDGLLGAINVGVQVQI